MELTKQEILDKLKYDTDIQWAIQEGISYLKLEVLFRPSTQEYVPMSYWNYGDTVEFMAEQIARLTASDLSISNEILWVLTDDVKTVHEDTVEAFVTVFKNMLALIATFDELTISLAKDQITLDDGQLSSDRTQYTDGRYIGLILQNTKSEHEVHIVTNLAIEDADDENAMYNGTLRVSMIFGYGSQGTHSTESDIFSVDINQFPTAIIERLRQFEAKH